MDASTVRKYLDQVQNCCEAQMEMYKDRPKLLPGQEAEQHQKMKLDIIKH